MEVHFSPEELQRLSQLANHTGKRDGEQLVKEWALRLLDRDEQFIAAVQKGIEQADRGEFVEHEEVWRNVEHILQF